MEHTRDSPEVNVFRTLSSFFFVENPFTGVVRLDILEKWVCKLTRTIHKQTRSSSKMVHRITCTRMCPILRISCSLVHGWGGRAVPIPPCSVDLTLMEFILWGIFKNHVYQSQSPNHLRKLKDRITIATVTVIPDIEECVITSGLSAASCNRTTPIKLQVITFAACHNSKLSEDLKVWS